jgi:hypothetical protein
MEKCPACGSSDIVTNPTTGKLHCNFCHREWSTAADALVGDIRQLQGVVTGSGTQDIATNFDSVITLRCTACGAEVVIDTAEATQARCHWCRNALSINQQIPNGAVPDAVIPFRLTKEVAQQAIEKFVGKREWFAHPNFKSEFNSANIMGVYLPYMVVDINARADLRGHGGHEVRSYTEGEGNDKKTFYDVDFYEIGRQFDLLIDDLTVEASSERLNQRAGVNTNNVINAILPFPLNDAVQYNSNYLRGFTSEKRDTNRQALLPLVAAQTRDIARRKVRDTTRFYDGGIRWDHVNVMPKGELWKTVYLPVWLYSYLEVKSDTKQMPHYVAVNGVTGQTMGSVPLHMPKLVLMSLLVELLAFAIAFFLTFVLVVQ